MHSQKNLLTYSSSQPVPFSANSAGFANRFLDLLIASLALIFFLPLIIMIAVAIKMFDPGPVFFRHRRIGKDGREFGCWKFRSMVVNAEARLDALLRADPAARREWAEHQKLTNDPRVTSLGRFLRKSSLDELPQLFNVLQGDMSIVGPRPIVQAEAERYGQYFAVYCLVRPGLTGLWQISGRSDVRYFERVLLDARYVSSKSVMRDLKIIILTVPSVLATRGSY
jgi:exopolysaccharide production protein ExoY